STAPGFSRGSGQRPVRLGPPAPSSPSGPAYRARWEAPSPVLLEAAMRMTVADVMTTDVKAVHKNAAFHAVAQTLVDNDVSGVPVLDDDGRVVGVVSEADLLHKEEFKERYFGERYRPSLRVRLRH